MKDWLRRSTRMTGETARRITGISTVFGGFQWADPGPPQRDRVLHFIQVLEDRRVLYNPSYLEVRGQVIDSLIEIRKACIEALKGFGEKDFAVVPIKAIGAACRRFQDDANLDFPLAHSGQHHHDHIDVGFFVALGALRATVGQQVALLSAHYDIEIDGDLAMVLPEADFDRRDRDPLHDRDDL